MTSYPPEQPAGRRNNGLTSGDWAALVDLDPRLSDTLLGSLAAVEVAAYVEPASGIDTVSRAVAMPRRPMDRLWVDPARADEARAVVGAEIADLAALLAEEDPTASVNGFIQAVPRTGSMRVLSPPIVPGVPLLPPTVEAEPAGDGSPAQAEEQSDKPDEEAAWQQIVEGWTKDTSASPVPRWPVTEEVDDSPPAERTWRRREPKPVEPDDDEDGPLPGWLEPEALDDDGHYVPPPPPPVPKVKRHTVGAVLCLVLGLVLVFAPNLVGQVSSTGLGLVGVLLMVGGAGALVWQVRDAPPTDSGPDDGAVV